MLPNEVVDKYVGKKQEKRLNRFKLSRMIDEDSNLIWCPYLDCEKEVRRTGGKSQK